MKNTSISLGPYFQEFIETQIKVGRYGSASEVVRAGLRLLEDHELKMQALQGSLAGGDAGDASGSPTLLKSSPASGESSPRSVG